MRFFLACALLVLANGVFAQSSPQQNLDTIMGRYKLHTSGIRPWHLVADVQLYNSKGKPADTGTVEEFYVGENRWRRVYAFPGFHQVLIHNEEGTFISGDQQPVPLPIVTAYDLALHPAPEPQEMDGANVSEFDYKISSMHLKCNALQRVFSVEKKEPPMGLFPTYCRDSANHLRMMIAMGGISAVYNDIGTFQGSDIPMTLSVVNNGTNYATFKVKELRTFDPASGEIFKPTSDAVKDTVATHVAGGVMAGKIIKKMAPVYPQSAREARISGTVILHAIIAKDGTIRKLQVRSAPSADLALSAMYAVRQWTYTPYLLAGRPTEVDTTITVNYNIGY